MTYATFYSPFPPIPLAEQSEPVLDLVDQQAQQLMTNLGVPYEHPFYQVCNAARGADVSLRGVPIRTGADMKEHLLSVNSEDAQHEYKYLSKSKMFADEYTYVRARQQVDGIPFAIGYIKRPNYRWDNPQYDEGVYMLWQFNSRGEIVFADACNLHQVVAESGEPVSVLGWEECLATLHQSSNFSGNLEAKVISVELCYAINSKHMTYPVWQFMVECKQAADSTLQQYLCSPIYVDAHTGKPL